MPVPNSNHIDINKTTSASAGVVLFILKWKKLSKKVKVFMIKPFLFLIQMELFVANSFYRNDLKILLLSLFLQVQKRERA